MQLSLGTKHLLTGTELASGEIIELIKLAQQLKLARSQRQITPYLSGMNMALLFSKPSLRTRFSFTVAMRELGGDVIESVTDTRKMEDPEDQARVLAGYCDAIMVRTHADINLQRMQEVSTVPIINGLSNLHHPCQALADLMTLHEIFGQLAGLQLSYIGDGNNVLHSLLLLGSVLGINIHYCCPPQRQPEEKILALATQRAEQHQSTIKKFNSPPEAVANANAVYTDVWNSMGFEEQDESCFKGYQVNEALLKHAKKEVVFMHCLPMERGKEVSITLPDQACSVIFQQSENRLHAQKALLIGLLAKPPITSSYSKQTTILEVVS